MNNESISMRLASRLARKQKNASPFRSDFVIADYRVEGKNAKLLIQYDNLMDTPSKEDVIASISTLYSNQNGCPRLVVDPVSVKFYPGKQAVTCSVHVPSIRRPYADVKRFNMKEIVAGTTFLGVDMSDTWALAKEGDAVFIERIEKEDIEKIIRERSKANAFRTYGGRSSVTLSQVEASYATDRYSRGDIVKLAHLGELRSGEILGLSESGAHIRLADGSQVTAALTSIQGLVEASKEASTFNKEALKEFFRKAYGYSEEELEKLVTYNG